MNATALRHRPDNTASALPRAAPVAVGADQANSAIAKEQPQTTNGADHSLTAQSLLAGRPWVGIEHNGQHYRLQTTRAGKLILTK